MERQRLLADGRVALLGEPVLRQARRSQPRSTLPRRVRLGGRPEAGQPRGDETYMRSQHYRPAQAHRSSTTHETHVFGELMSRSFFLPSRGDSRADVGVFCGGGLVPRRLGLEENTVGVVDVVVCCGIRSISGLSRCCSVWQFDVS